MKKTKTRKNKLTKTKARKNRSIKIKQTKRNFFYMVLGRIITGISIFVTIEILLYKAFIYIMDNCITTLN